MGTLLEKIFTIIPFVEKNIVGYRVRKARKEQKITQMELAARLQISGIKIDRPAISKLESGRRPVSDIEIASGILNLPLKRTPRGTLLIKSSKEETPISFNISLFSSSVFEYISYHTSTPSHILSIL